MFFPERMRKVDIFVLQSFKETVKKELLRFGDFETINVPENKLREYFFKKTPVEERLSKLNEFRKRIEYLFSLVKTFWEQIEEEKYEVYSYDILKEEEIEESLLWIENKLNELNVQLEACRKKRFEYELNIKRNYFLSSENVNLQDYKDLKFFGVYFGSIPSSNRQGLNNALKEFPCELKFLGDIGKESILLLVYPKKLKEKIDGILRNAYFTDYGLPIKKEKEEGLLSIGLSLIGIQDEELWIEKQIKNLLVKSLPILEKLKSSVDYYQSLNILEKEMVSTKDVVLISGWVPEKKFDRLKLTIEDVTEKKCAIISLPDYEVVEKEGIIPPTRLDNPNFLKPFEGLVLNFGVPRYDEVDPTFIVGISYVLMYGMMFGDLGHGIVLFLLGLAGLFVRKFSYIRFFARIMCYVGLSSAFFGILYGSVFGFEDLIRSIWIRPMSHIMEILLFAVGFGVWMVSLGVFLNIINCIKEKQYGKLFFSSMGLPGIGFYWSFLYIFLMIGLKKQVGYLVYLPLFFLVLIALEKPIERIFFRKETEEGASFNPIIIVIEIVETILTFLTNTISFMRVGAFALNHSALMSAIFIISSMFRNPVLEWLVILGGNIFVIIFEGFIVSIQVLRLEYYEFFMKFFRGSGKLFEGVTKKA